MNQPHHRLDHLSTEDLHEIAAGVVAAAELAEVIGRHLGQDARPPRTAVGAGRGRQPRRALRCCTTATRPPPAAAPRRPHEITRDAVEPMTGSKSAAATAATTKTARRTALLRPTGFEAGAGTLRIIVSFLDVGRRSRRRLVRLRRW
ncbi:hypothetical protein AB2L28_13995 [Kineococcus sp. TBRC 1896]|uniref:Uncharacterized protein n=1 Tax=Kineococcus mangrovi TaxID=1660183 RepID=A0ABV4I806_9ACTN